MSRYISQVGGVAGCWPSLIGQPPRRNQSIAAELFDRRHRVKRQLRAGAYLPRAIQPLILDEPAHYLA